MPPHDDERRHDDRNEDARAIHGLTHILADWLAESKLQFQWMVTHHHFATKQDIESSTAKIMSVISDFLAQQTQFNTEQEAAVDAVIASQTALQTALTGVTGDIAELNRQILVLQNSSGAVTPEDQATINTLQTKGAALVAKSQALATALAASAAALAALDDLTPPAVVTPPAEPTP